jgi:glucans biosynthesis protein C
MASQTEQGTSQFPGVASTAEPVQAAAAPQGTRLLFIDNLRIVLICGVLVQHLAVTYGALGDWDYRDPAPICSPGSSCRSRMASAWPLVWGSFS